LAGAVQDVINMMAGKMSTGAFAAPTQPTAPALPALLQRLAPPGQAQPPGSMTQALGGAASLPMPNVAPSAGAPNPLAAAGVGSPSGNTTAPVTINIGGQGQSSAPPPPGGYAPPAQQPGTYGALSGGMPSMLQQYAPPTTDFVHQLWGKELGSGAIQSPYAAMNQQVPGPTPMAV
jgi:hypothetical protein